MHQKIIEKDIIHVISKFDIESLLNYQRFPILMQIKDRLLKLIVIITQVEFGLIGLHHSMSHLPSKFWISKVNLFQECKIYENRQIPRLDHDGTPIRNWLMRGIASVEISQFLRNRVFAFSVEIIQFKQRRVFAISVEIVQLLRKRVFAFSVEIVQFLRKRVFTLSVENVKFSQKHVINLSVEIIPHRDRISIPVLKWLSRVIALHIEKVKFDHINKKSSICSNQRIQKVYVSSKKIVHTNKFSIQEHCSRAFRYVRDYVFIRKHASSHLEYMCLIVLVCMYVNNLYLLKIFAVKNLILLNVKDKMMTENNLKELRGWKIGKLFELVYYKADRIKIVKVRLKLSCDSILVAKLLLALEMISENVKDMVESRERLKSISAAQINVIYNLSRNC